MSMNKHVLATIGQSEEMKSFRADKLPQDALDLLSYAFAAGFPASDILPIPMNAAEVRLDDPVRWICAGGDGFIRHGGGDSLRYFNHAGDPDWAIIFAWDCAGDAERGAELLYQMATQEM